MLRPPRRAIPTIPGWFALGAPTFLGLAAVTATNNLLFLVLGATLGAIVLSGILSERNIRDVEVRVRPIGPAYAGEAARLEVRFERRDARRPAFDLRFREVSRRAPFAGWARPRAPAVLDAHLPVLDGSTGHVLAERVFPRRGRARLGLAELSTRYPFGLLSKARDVTPRVEVVVRPRPISAPLALARPPRVGDEGAAARARGQGLDVHGLRERVERDPAHRVHALRSLALGRQVVLEMSGVERPLAALHVATDPGADPEALERALEVAQAALRAWDAAGFAVGLSTNTRVFPPGGQPLDALLDHLAEVEPGPPRARPAADASSLVPQGAARPASGPYLVVGPDGALREGA
jgi:uncharacterized protein (DUF58 family)